LWAILSSAQSNPSGIPQVFLELKAEEARVKRIEDDKIKTEVIFSRKLLISGALACCIRTPMARLRLR
jgi:hypothetical protein